MIKTKKFVGNDQLGSLFGDQIVQGIILQFNAGNCGLSKDLLVSDFSVCQKYKFHALFGWVEFKPECCNLYYWGILTDNYPVRSLLHQ